MEFVPLPPQSFSRDVENFGDTCVFMTSCKRKLCETCLVFASTSNFFLVARVPTWGNFDEKIWGTGL